MWSNTFLYTLLYVTSLYNAEAPFLTRFCIIYTVYDVSSQMIQNQVPVKVYKKLRSLVYKDAEVQ